ncbi:MAG: hypothetical protein IPM23_22205 [Candidatus Melainabacteria bacterium]|nr:hypothetical protein [Candidatus Melainabacteria bacterium]
MTTQTKFERRGAVDSSGRDIIVERTEVVRNDSEIGWAVALILLVLVIAMGYVLLTNQQTLDQALLKLEQMESQYKLHGDKPISVPSLSAPGVPTKSENEQQAVSPAVVPAEAPALTPAETPGETPAENVDSPATGKEAE